MEITAQQKLSRLDAALDRSRAGDDAWALHEFEELERLSGHPQDIALLRFFQTRCLTDLGRAAEALQRILTVDKSWLAFTNQVDYEFEFARIERALGHKSEALARADMGLKMVEKAPDEQDIRIVSRHLQTIRGILFAKTERYDEAIPMLEAVPTEDEGWAEARICLGDCNVFKRQFHEAVEAYSGVVSCQREVDPIHRNTAIRNIGCAYYYMRDYTKAVEYLAKVENAYDDCPDLKAELFALLASTYSHLGKMHEAARYCGFGRGTGSIQ